MKSLFILVILLTFCASQLKSQNREMHINKKNVYLEGSLGVGSIIGDNYANVKSPYFPIGFELGYLLSDNFGIVPVSIYFQRFVHDISNISYSGPLLAKSYKGTYLNMDELFSEPINISFMPGIIFRSSSNKGVKAFGQCNFGLYLEDKYFIEDKSKSDLSFSFCGGIEYGRTNSFIFKSRYQTILINSGNISIIDFLFGGKIYW